MNWIKLSYIFPSILDLKIFHEYINTLYTRIYTFLSKSSLKLSSLFKQNFRTFNAKLSEIPSYRISEKLSDKIFPIIKKKNVCSFKKRRLRPKFRAWERNTNEDRFEAISKNRTICRSRKRSLEIVRDR